MIKLEVLKDFMIFNKLTADQLLEVRASLAEKKFKSGEMIFDEGDKGNELYLLLEGEVEISRSLTLALPSQNEQKREKSLIRLDAYSRTFFGEVGLIESQGERTAAVKAVSDINTAVLTRDKYDALSEKDPALGMRMLKNISIVLCQRLRVTNANVLKITTAFSLALERQK